MLATLEAGHHLPLSVLFVPSTDLKLQDMARLLEVDPDTVLD